tara:strand:+ start:19435 stop:19926 length:492 start_codon:yes stop_codon:yes gene_type:complete
MNIHDMEIENISEDFLFCYPCTETKKKCISHLDENQSVLDMNLRPITRMLPPQLNVTIDENEFLGKGTMFVPPDMSYLDEANIDEELNDMMFHRHVNELDDNEDGEFILRSRAMLGDENRELYDDGQHTNFEEVEEYWKAKHEAQEENDSLHQQNSHILGLEF